MNLGVSPSTVGRRGSEDVAATEKERSWRSAVRLAAEKGAQLARGAPAAEQPGGWSLHFHGANWGDVAGRTEGKAEKG